MSRVFPVLVSLALLLPFGLVACAQKKHELPGAVYAQAVPLYQDPRYGEMMGGESGADFDAITHESVSWFFKTDDPLDQVVAFYEKALPGARKEIEGETVTFTFVPQGAEADEEVQVILTAGDIQIHESTKAGKHQDPSCYDQTMDEMGLGFLK